MNEIATAGVLLKYAIESEAGTRPTSGYTVIPGVKSIPDFNPEPESLETTDLSQTKYKTYVPGLMDVSGSITFGANLTEALIDLWNSIIAASDAAKAENKATWFEVCIPSFQKSFYFAGVPSPLGLAAIEVNAVLTTDLHITPSGFENEPWAAKSTT